MRTASSSSAVVFVAFVLVLAPARAAMVPAATEVALAGQANDQQTLPAVAVRTGGSLLLWDDQVAGVQARAIDTAGNAASPITLAATDPLPPVPFDVVDKEVHEPALATKTDGSFLAAWTELTVHHYADLFIDNRVVLSSRVVARLFHADGTPAGNPLEIAKSSTSSVVGRAAVLATSDGWWVAWDEVGGTSPGVRLRRIDTHSRLGNPTLVGAAGERAALALGGSLVIVGWEKPLSVTTSQVYARLYKTSGRAVGNALALEATPNTTASRVSVAARSTGNFLAAWEASPVDSSQRQVDAQLVTRTGGKSGAELHLAGGSPGAGAGAPRLVTTGEGWGALWVEWNGGSIAAATIGSFTTAGAAIGTPAHVSQEQVPLEDDALAIGKDGRAIAAWTGYDGAFHLSARARLLQAPPPPSR